MHMPKIPLFLAYEIVTKSTPKVYDTFKRAREGEKIQVSQRMGEREKRKREKERERER